MTTITEDQIDASHPADVCIGVSPTLRLHITTERDNDTEAPWEHCDGHGPVSEWTTRDKRPGERVLSSDGRSRRYYDFAKAVRIAKRDGWDAPPYRTGTKGERAVRAVERNFEYLRAWCADEWEWLGVVVSLVSVDADDNETELVSDSLWGIESCAGPDGSHYWKTRAAEIANRLLAAHAKEAVERTAWEACGVVTA